MRKEEEDERVCYTEHFSVPKEDNKPTVGRARYCLTMKLCSSGKQ